MAHLTVRCEKRPDAATEQAPAMVARCVHHMFGRPVGAHNRHLHGRVRGKAADLRTRAHHHAAANDARTSAAATTRADRGP
eukprot:scaffold2915_cov282-Prasinococcus_capsulatus_cf.AAC.4